MDIVNHPLCTTSIGAPSDMQDDCSALPVAYHTDEHGTWAMSFWKPNGAELAQLGAEGCVTLHVRAAGRQHPVVAIGTYPASTPATLKEIAASDDDPDMGRGVDLVDEIQWCLNYGLYDDRVEKCLMRCVTAIPTSDETRLRHLALYEEAETIARRTRTPAVAQARTAIEAALQKSELDRIKRLAACGTVNSFLALPEQDKRYWFAQCIDESDRRKKNDVRFHFLHSTNRDAEGYEYGVCKVKHDAAGNIESFLWCASDHSDVDAAAAGSQSKIEDNP